MNKKFTLIELLVVVAIIGILASMLLPALAKSKAVGKQAVCLNGLKQIYLWTRMYIDSNEDMLPHANGVGADKHNRTWDDLLGTFDSRNLDINANSPEGVNPYLLSTPVRSNINFTYRCPLDMRRNGDWIARSYSINAELAGMGWSFIKGNISPDSVANPSSTILYGERIVSNKTSGPTFDGLWENGCTIGNDAISAFTNDIRAGASADICGSAISCDSWTSNHPKSGYLPWTYLDGHQAMAHRAVASFLPQ